MCMCRLRVVKGRSYRIKPASKYFVCFVRGLCAVSQGGELLPESGPGVLCDRIGDVRKGQSQLEAQDVCGDSAAQVGYRPVRVPESETRREEVGYCCGAGSEA